MKRPIHVALIGCQFMGKAHSHALRNLHMFADDLPVTPVMKMVCDVNESAMQTMADRFGWECREKSWETVVSHPEIDVVDIATPGNTHHPIAIAAAQNGKHVLCEKPLANSAAEASAMHEAAENHKIKHLVNFNYRRVPAVALARQLVTDGRLGEIYHFRGVYQQDWPLDPGFPFVWRFDRQVAGAGSMADKGSHIIDLARYLVGEFEQVASRTSIVVPERADGEGVRRPVTTDDAAVFLAQFDNGALGVFQTSRMSAGHKNSLCFEINGSRGSVRFDLERLNELEVYSADEEPSSQGFRTVSVTQGVHPYVDRWWPPGHVLGWEHTFIHQYFEFLKAIGQDTAVAPSFYDGMKCQQVIDAIERAATEARWVSVSEC